MTRDSKKMTKIYFFDTPTEKSCHHCSRLLGGFKGLSRVNIGERFREQNAQTTKFVTRTVGSRLAGQSELDELRKNLRDLN